jgi:signal transduction histidine kinase
MSQVIFQKDEELTHIADTFINIINKLKKAAKLKENFIAGMIHDIRNPISSMICSLDYMKENELI